MIAKSLLTILFISMIILDHNDKIEAVVGAVVEQVSYSSDCLARCVDSLLSLDCGGPVGVPQPLGLRPPAIAEQQLEAGAGLLQVMGHLLHRRGGRPRET